MPHNYLKTKVSARQSNPSNGFSTLELLVVIIIIAIATGLTTVSVGMIDTYKTRTRNFTIERLLKQASELSVITQQTVTLEVNNQQLTLTYSPTLTFTDFKDWHNQVLPPTYSATPANPANQANTPSNTQPAATPQAVAIDYIKPIKLDGNIHLQIYPDQQNNNASAQMQWQPNRTAVAAKVQLWDKEDPSSPKAVSPVWQVNSQGEVSIAESISNAP